VLDPAHEALLRYAATHIAEAITAAMKEESITRYATQVGAINEAGLRLLSTQDLNELVKIATSSLAMILQCDACVLRLRDPATGRYTIRSYFGSADARLQKGLFAFDKKFVIQLLRRRQPILAAEVASDPELSAEGSSVRTALGVPLRHPNGTVGTLAMYDKLVPTRSIGLHARGPGGAGPLRRLRRARDPAGDVPGTGPRDDRFDEPTGLPNRCSSTAGSPDRARATGGPSRS
jgi:hypothetical protein